MEAEYEAEQAAAAAALDAALGAPLPLGETMHEGMLLPGGTIKLGRAEECEDATGAYCEESMRSLAAVSAAQSADASHDSYLRPKEPRMAALVQLSVT